MVAGHPIRPSPTASTCHLAGRPMRRLLRARHGDLPGQRPHRPGAVRAGGQINDADLWAAHMQQKRELTDFIAGRLARQFARHGESPDQLREVRAGARPEGDDHRLRPAIRDLQARRPDLPRRGTPGAAPLGSRKTGADRHRRQGAPGRSARDRASSSASSSCRAPTGCAAGSSSSRTTTCASPASWWRGGRLAQQSAAATGGVGHVRHEGRDERRAQRQRPRRLVGRGLQRGQRLGDRRARAAPDEGAQDEADAEELYRLLEDEIVPRFFERDDEGCPGDGWPPCAPRSAARSGSSAPRAC